MSCIISITRTDIPENDDAAWEYLDELREKESGESSNDFIYLIKNLMERYPCICDESDVGDDRDFIWSDGPLINNAGHNITTLGLSTMTEEAMPFIIKTANSLGFVVFDEQTGIISRP